MCGMQRDEEDGEEKSKLVESEREQPQSVLEKGGVGIQFSAKRPPAAKGDPQYKGTEGLTGTSCNVGFLLCGVIIIIDTVLFLSNQ